jgi:tRNA pseudouridine38-40 synthase
MPFYAVRLFYLGTNYHGSQYQPGLETIQGQLIEALNGWDDSPHDTKSIRFSGRTDKGVHSLGQIVTIKTSKPLDVNQVNRLLPDDIAIWAHVEIKSEFNPRHHVLLRHYRYYLPTENKSSKLSLMRQAAQNLVGTNSYHYLSKPDSNRTTYATLLDVSLSKCRDAIVFDVYGTNFLWKQVRKMVTLLLSIGKGEMISEKSQEVVQGTWTPPGGIRPASEEGLILMEVVVNFDFVPNKRAMNRIRKFLNHRLGFLREAVVTLDGLTSDLRFYQYPFY